MPAIPDPLAGHRRDGEIGSCPSWPHRRGRPAPRFPSSSGPPLQPRATAPGRPVRSRHAPGRCRWPRSHRRFIAQSGRVCKLNGTPPGDRSRQHIARGAGDGAVIAASLSTSTLKRSTFRRWAARPRRPGTLREGFPHAARPGLHNVDSKLIQGLCKTSRQSADIVLVVEVEHRLDPRRSAAGLPPLIDFARKAPRRHRQSPGGAAFRSRPITGRPGLRPRRGRSAIGESAAGEFARSARGHRRSSPSGAYRGDHRAAAMQLQFGEILAGFGVGPGKPQHQAGPVSARISHHGGFAMRGGRAPCRPASAPRGRAAR